MDEWMEVYEKGLQVNKWPFTDLVSLVKRHMPELKGKHVLELGCGTGPNAMFFIAEGAQYFGIDQSQQALLRTPIHELAHYSIGDFTRSLALSPHNLPSWIPVSSFDLIFDRAAVTHNDTESIQRCFGLVYDALKPGGLYIGVDWFSNHHADYMQGERVDEFTRTNILRGQFTGIGKVHFSTYTHLMRDLFNKFECLDMQAKLVLPVQLNEPVSTSIGTFNFVMRKPL